MPSKGTKFGALLATRIDGDSLAEFVANSERIGSTKDIVLRDLVRAFNALCEDGRRPTYPFTVSSPAYRVENGHVVNAIVPEPDAKKKPSPERLFRPKSA